jgi:hypothetical protein
LSKLLLNEQPLLIMPQLANAIGLNESIVLQQIHYWLEINRKANVNHKSGHYWTYNTYDKWKEQFPFWSVNTVRRIIKSLEDKKLIVYGNYNKLKFDRTKWYRIDYERLDMIESHPSAQNGQMEQPNLSRTIPETKAETKRKYNRQKVKRLELTHSDMEVLMKTPGFM